MFNYFFITFISYCFFFFILSPSFFSFFFFLNDPATPEIYPLSLHDALPISASIESGETERTGDGKRRQPIESAAVSDLTIAIRAPAVDSVVGRQPAGVKSGGGHRQEAQPTRDGCWGPLVGRTPMMAVAKLAPARRPPEIGRAHV